MRSNVKNRIEQKNEPHVTMFKYNIRAQAQAEVQKMVDEAEAKRQTDEQEAALRGRKP